MKQLFSLLLTSVITLSTYAYSLNRYIYSPERNPLHNSFFALYAGSTPIAETSTNKNNRIGAIPAASMVISIRYTFKISSFMKQVLITPA